MIRKRGNEWVLVSKESGRTLGTHTTRAQAVAQEQAINISKHKRRKGK